MRKLLVAFLGAVALTAVGCQNDRGDAEMSDSRDVDNARTVVIDDCRMCEGVQRATAEGRCPSCKMKLADMDR